MKTGQSRIDDSINYIVNHVQAPWSAKTIQDTLTNTNASVKTVGRQRCLKPGLHRSWNLQRVDNIGDPRFVAFLVLALILVSGLRIVFRAIVVRV